MSKEEKIILYDSPEAARLLTPDDLLKTPIWVSRPGNGNQVITTDEHIARYAGCTHQTCPETGEVFEKRYSHGPTVRARREWERYNNLRQVEVTDDTKFGILYDGSNVYDDVYELFDYLIEQDAVGIGMVTVAMPVDFSELDESYWLDEMPEDYEFSPTVDSLIRQLNAAIAEENPAYYALGEARPTDDFLEGMKARFQEYRKEWLQQQ